MILSAWERRRERFKSATLFRQLERCCSLFLQSDHNSLKSVALHFPSRATMLFKHCCYLRVAMLEFPTRCRKVTNAGFACWPIVRMAQWPAERQSSWKAKGTNPCRSKKVLTALSFSTSEMTSQLRQNSWLCLMKEFTGFTDKKWQKAWARRPCKCGLVKRESQEVFPLRVATQIPPRIL